MEAAARTGRLTARPVRGRRDLKRFVKVPFRLHRDHDQWVPPLIYERRRFLDRKRNPFFEHAEAECFLCEREGRPVGRISAQIDQRWDEFQGVRARLDPEGRFTNDYTDRVLGPVGQRKVRPSPR